MPIPPPSARELDLDGLLAGASPATARILPENLAFEFSALVVYDDGETADVVCPGQPSAAGLARLERASGRRLRIHLKPAAQLVPELARCYGALQSGRDSAPAGEREDSATMLDALLRRAMLSRASDIHFLLEGDALRMRLRIDGSIVDDATLDGGLAPRVFLRAKLFAGMDIAEKRLPQDGRFSFQFESREVDVRCAAIPSVRGEALALRILDLQTTAPNLDELGFPSEVRLTLRRLLAGSGGLIVVCGPTGSGKTTALYAMLEELDRGALNVCSVEDPVERLLDRVTQVAVNVRAGLDFSHALRALLRQDPDVIMIGEIRDAETAQTALAAGLSGQLVLTTVHGADGARAIERLVELGLPRATLAGAISAVVSLRLMRKRCTACDGTTSKSCDRCAGSGHRGRTALADVAVIDDVRRAALAAGPVTHDLTLSALEAQAREAVSSGLTSASEFARLFPTASGV